MTREIKFRAWDKKNEQMVEPLNISFRCGHIDCVHHAKYHKGGVYLFNGETSSDFELMQYTGLKDKNGKEIYEGDVFGKLGGDKERLYEYEYHGKVYFDEDLLAFCVEKSNGGWQYLHDYGPCEVIGNVYENPDLLTL